jgi:TetR/AcrR family transcriptional regulator
VRTRNPGRTRGRILSAALKEFAAKGFAGARVDAIARRAASTSGCFTIISAARRNCSAPCLRRKIGERQAWAESLSGDPAETLPFWFEACKDADWIRLLEWEALQAAAKSD